MAANIDIPEDVKIFLVESYENLDQVEQDLVELEKFPNNKELINGIFRSIHTIKGNSGFLGYKNLETLCHRGEAMLDRMRNGQLNFDAAKASLLLRTIDAIRKLLLSVETSLSEGNTDTSGLIAEIEKALTA